jgi:hypothetical protein
MLINLSSISYAMSPAHELKTAFSSMISAIKAHPERKNMIVVIHLDHFFSFTPQNIQALNKKKEVLMASLQEKSQVEQEKVILDICKQEIEAIIIEKDQMMIVDFLKDLQKIGTRVIGITYLFPFVADNILAHFKKLGLDLSGNSISMQTIEIPIQPEIKVIYKNGILFAGNPTFFDSALGNLLKKTKNTTKKILIIPAQTSTEDNDESDA